MRAFCGAKDRRQENKTKKEADCNCNVISSNKCLEERFISFKVDQAIVFYFSSKRAFSSTTLQFFYLERRQKFLFCKIKKVKNLEKVYATSYIVLKS